MRRILTFLATVAMMFASVSCVKDIVGNQELMGEGMQTVTFTVAAPELVQTTKAISDGKSVDKLEYAVYRAETYTDSQGKVYEAGEYIASLSEGDNATIRPINSPVPAWEVTLVLAKNVKYDIAFWAQNEDAPYEFDKAAKTITVTDDYQDDANDEMRDAFFHLCEDYIVVTEETNVALTRPFAQINFGASDYDPYVTSMNIDMTSTITTEATVMVPTVFNVLDGTVSGEAPLAFVATSIPYENGTDKVLTTVAGKTYHWMAMNYILASDEKTINLKGTFNYNGDKIEIEVPSVPYKRNYKTNIIGDLFTGEAKFEVVVVPNYADEDGDGASDDIIMNLDDIQFAFDNGGTYVMKGDLNLSTVSALLLDSGKDVVLDLNGNTITGGARPSQTTTASVKSTTATKPEWSLGIMVEKGTLTIKDSSGEGKIVTQDATYSIAVWAKGTGVVNIEGGYFENAGDGCEVIYASGEGKVNISGGYFKPTKKLGVELGTANPYTALNLHDGSRTTASIVVTGGTFYGFDPANNLSEGANTNFVADGYQSTKSESADAAGVYEYTVTQKADEPVVPEVTDYSGEWFIAVESKIATTLSGNYGYIPVSSPWTKDEAMAGTADNVYTFAAVEGGYTIKNPSGKYLYAGARDDGWYNTFSLAAEVEADNPAYVWTIEANADGTYNIANVANSYYMQYTTYNNIGVYETNSSSYVAHPVLVKAENVMPTVSLDATSVSFDAEGGSKTVTATSDKAISLTATSSDEAFTVSVSGMVVTVAASAVTEAKSAKLTLKYEYEGYSFSEEVAIAQSAPVSGDEIVDVLTAEVFGITTAAGSYADFTSAAMTSGATYAAQANGGQTYIQLRSKENNSGVVTTASDKNVIKIEVSWNSSTNAARSIEVYGSNTAYTAPSQLYADDTKGTLIGTAAIADATANVSVIEVPADTDYKFIGIKSKSGALYLDSVKIYYEK